MFDKNWNIILVILIIVLVIAYFRNCYEGFAVSNDEAIANVAALYNKDNMTLTNLTTTGTLTSNGTITSNGELNANNISMKLVKGNVPATGEVTAGGRLWSAEGKLCLGGTCITEQDLIYLRDRKFPSLNTTTLRVGTPQYYTDFTQTSNPLEISSPLYINMPAGLYGANSSYPSVAFVSGGKIGGLRLDPQGHLTGWIPNGSAFGAPVYMYKQ